MFLRFCIDPGGACGSDVRRRILVFILGRRYRHKIFKRRPRQNMIGIGLISVVAGFVLLLIYLIGRRHNDRVCYKMLRMIAKHFILRKSNFIDTKNRPISARKWVFCAERPLLAPNGSFCAKGGRFILDGLIYTLVGQILSVLVRYRHTKLCPSGSIYSGKLGVQPIRRLLTPTRKTSQLALP